ncbi:MAG: DUF411 domain-containing protein [Candidatus Thiodiazotropha sp. (ex Dulcina madagascariensis)]|nr:DUF411 domain-containing protein [Candidatus Thiodiazotropha sp. (ex Dulcina madagascariensis)]
MTHNKPNKSHKKSIYVKIAAWLMAGAVPVIGGLLMTQQASEAADIVVYKSPTCGCCKAWVTHLRDNGFSVEVHDKNNMQPIKQAMGVPDRLQSCHTAQIEGYVIEGHVPADDIIRLLKEKPAVTGITAPGMPMGSPGMEGPRKDDYDVLTFKKNGKTRVFARH